MAREMLINVSGNQECRVAVVEGGRLEELYVERPSLSYQVGNIYKTKVVNIESGIQAAFVELGTGRNGFLHISDIHPRWFAGNGKDLTEAIGRRKALEERPLIQNSLRKGQELIVQVTKEGIKNKGPTVSTYLAIPGKYLVMMPWMRKQGVSHKIEDEQERNRLRDIFDESLPPKGHGFIIRTAAQGCSKRDLQNDLAYLKKLWAAIEKRSHSEKAPAELYQESDLVIRALRDVFNSKVRGIICDSDSVVRKINDFLCIIAPRLKDRVTYYDGKIPIFHKYHIEEEIAKAQSRSVPLQSGGSIVIEQTEALVAIDVNSGRYRKQQTAEETAFKINLEAAGEIARQLRLRDLGGLIVCDFIDMREARHRKEAEKVFRAAVKPDRAHNKILRMSMFGVIEMTRQRMRPSLQSSTYLVCPTCGGNGFIKSHESLTIEVIRLLNLAASKEQVKRMELFVSLEAADFLQNERRIAITQIEQASDKRIIIHGSSLHPGEKYELICYNDKGTVITL